jgi:cytochrome oxidase assembly protein ShyY1
MNVRTISPDALASAYPYELLRVVLRRTTEPPETPGVMTVIELPELTNGPHLSYAIQWFTFATIALVGSVTLSVRGGTREKREGRREKEAG